MKRRDFLQAAGGALAALTIPSVAGSEQSASAEPLNILWISCEDISPNLGCYGDGEARTPNLDALAAQGARYTNAFSVSGVCAPSRSCIITGMYPTTLGTCHMRSNHPPRPPVQCFPEFLRAAGYFCTNNSKTDYQFSPPDTVWDECNKKAHWRHRPDAKQPFFAVFNFTITHESQVGQLQEDAPAFRKRLPADAWHDPAKASLPPYYPDTPLIRKHWAHYYDLITIMDAEAGKVLGQLEEDGLADNTLVFFFSDHGAGLPRAKRWMYDSGLHVPLLIRWPGRIAPNSVEDRLVSFLDFAPTLLSVAGVAVPGYMQGTPFLGSAAGAPREYIFAARDRMDERYDMIRAVRDQRFKYIRNYEPYRPYAQYLEYCESWPVMQEMHRVEAAGGLKGPEKLFFRATKPVEELYDTSVDPFELNNLVDAPECRDVLTRLRAALEAWMRDAKDVGFVPEVELDAWLEPGGKKLPLDVKPVKYAPAADADASLFGRSINAWINDLNGGDPLTRLRAIKTLGLIGQDAIHTLIDALRDPDSAVAYWAGASLGWLGVKDPQAVTALEGALTRPEAAARLGAAQALCQLGAQDKALPFLLEAIYDPNRFVRVFTVQIFELMNPRPPEVRDALQAVLKDEENYVVRVAEHALAQTPG